MEPNLQSPHPWKLHPSLQCLCPASQAYVVLIVTFYCCAFSEVSPSYAYLHSGGEDRAYKCQRTGLPLFSFASLLYSGSGFGVSSFESFAQLHAPSATALVLAHARVWITTAMSGLIFWPPILVLTKTGRSF